MKTKAQRIEAVFEVMEKLIAEKQESNEMLSWGEIKAAVEEAKIPVKNWLTEVRSVLQDYLNEGWMIRYKDVTVEKYIIMKGMRKSL